MERRARALYLVHDVFEGIGTVDCEANEEEVGLGIGERSKTIVFFLAGCIPQCEFDCFPARLMRGVCDIILKHSWNVFLIHSLATSFTV